MTTANKGTSLNMGRLVAGIIVLAIGLLLVVLTFVLPEDRMMFMIGEENLPIVPALFLVGLGLYLIFTARKVEEDSVEVIVEMSEIDELKAAEDEALNKRLETMGWGLFLIMLGGLAFIPNEQVPDGVWSIGIGVIMLGLNATRYYYGLKMSGFTTFLGILALLSGIAQMLGLHSLDGALLLIILGAYLLLKPWFDKRQLFG